MPELFRLFGIRFYFYSREHEPIHVHIKNSDGRAKFIINQDGIVLDENKGIKVKDLKLAESIIEENKELIIATWNKHFGNK